MIICVVGPTAVGKTKLSVELAKKYNGGGHKGASGFPVKELPFKKL